MSAVHSYKLNTEGARRVGVSSRIDEKGAYAGMFTRAEAVVSSKGTAGIEFAFKANDGATADYLTVWTVNAAGEELAGRRMVDALLTVMRVREISVQRGKVTKFNAQARAEETVQADIFPDLMNKPVGVFLVREEYEKNDGTTGNKMALVGVFDASTKQLPSEILDKKQGAELFERVTAALKDRPLRKGSAKPAARQDSGASFDDMDDDIPF